MKSEEHFAEIETATDETGQDADDAIEGDIDFKITVRKLEMPVRPRGVLAE